MDFTSFFISVGEQRWNFQRFSFPSLSIPKPQAVWHVIKLGKNLASKHMEGDSPGFFYLQGHWSGLFCLGAEWEQSILCWKAEREKRKLVTYFSCKIYVEEACNSLFALICWKNADVLKVELFSWKNIALRNITLLNTKNLLREMIPEV